MSLSLTYSFSQSKPGKHTRKQKGTLQSETSETCVGPEAGTWERKQHRMLSLSAQPADQSLQTGPQMSTAGGSWQCTDSCIHWQVAVLKQGVKMPQLCVSSSAAKADTSESISRANSSQLERHDPRADAWLCWDQGSIHTKINEDLGFSHKTMPGKGSQHMPGAMLQVSQEELGGLSPPKSSQLPPRPPSHCCYCQIEWHHLRLMAKETQPQRAILVPDFLGIFRISLKGGMVAASLGNTEQNQDKSRPERPKQNMRPKRRNSKGSWRSVYKVYWEQLHSEIILGFESKPGVIRTWWWLQLVFCVILDSSGLTEKPDWRNLQRKSIKQSNLRWQMENEKRGTLLVRVIFL